MTNPPEKKAVEYIRQFPAKPENVGGLDGWVHQLYEYVEREALEAIDWYTRHTSKKKKGSLAFRYLAIVFGGLAGLLPIVFAVVPPNWRALSPVPAEQASLFVSLLIGIAAVPDRHRSLWRFHRQQREGSRQADF